VPICRHKSCWIDLGARKSGDNGFGQTYYGNTVVLRPPRIIVIPRCVIGSASVFSALYELSYLAREFAVGSFERIDRRCHCIFSVTSSGQLGSIHSHVET
jgi:hypothetical protein